MYTYFIQDQEPWAKVNAQKYVNIQYESSKADLKTRKLKLFNTKELPTKPNYDGKEFEWYNNSMLPFCQCHSKKQLKMYSKKKAKIKH